MNAPQYYWPDGSLKWSSPINVEHLILQLKTLDPMMKVSSITHIDGYGARAYGLSMSRERWDEAGWLNFKLEGPECLAIWATVRPVECPTCPPHTVGTHTADCRALASAGEDHPATQEGK
jgi:hypothetical protein